MASAWGTSWGTSWGNSWGTTAAAAEPAPAQGGTILQRGSRKRAHRGGGVILGRKEYEEILALLLKAAEKTGEAVDRKTPRPTEKAVKAAAKNVTADIAADLATVWARTAAFIARISEIDNHYHRMAAELAEWFRVKAEREIEEDDEEAILLLLQ